MQILRNLRILRAVNQGFAAKAENRPFLAVFSGSQGVSEIKLTALKTDASWTVFGINPPPPLRSAGSSLAPPASRRDGYASLECFALLDLAWT
jgi:hypothetical protein